MVKDHSDSNRGNSFRLAARILLYSTDRIAHTKAFVTPVVEQQRECNNIINRAGFRTGQARKLPRGVHNQGTSTYVLSPF